MIAVAVFFSIVSVISESREYLEHRFVYLNQLYVRKNGMQLTSNMEIDQLHMMSIFTKLFPKI